MHEGSEARKSLILREIKGGPMMKIVWARGWREGGGFVGPYPGKGRDLRVLMVKQD